MSQIRIFEATRCCQLDIHGYSYGKKKRRLPLIWTKFSYLQINMKRGWICFLNFNLIKTMIEESISMIFTKDPRRLSDRFRYNSATVRRQRFLSSPSYLNENYESVAQLERFHVKRWDIPCIFANPLHGAARGYHQIRWRAIVGPQRHWNQQTHADAPRYALGSQYKQENALSMPADAPRYAVSSRCIAAHGDTHSRSPVYFMFFLISK